MSKITGHLYAIAGVNTKLMKPEALAEISRFADHLAVPVYMTSGFRGFDAGQHGRGLAGDIVVPAWAGRLHDLYLESTKFKFTGIGVYPDWHYDSKVVGGLHLDLRVAKPARWLGLGTGKNNTYLALSDENLKKYGVIP